MKRKLPPFSVEIERRIKSGEKIATIYISAGPAAWSRALPWKTEAGRRAFLAWPPNEDPSAYDWRLVRSRECIVFGTGASEEQRDQIAIELYRAGAVRVVMLAEARIISYQTGRAA